nr:transposase, MuDR, MULE transposase domain protein [Tanacetum cinerariifolium]
MAPPQQWYIRPEGESFDIEVYDTYNKLYSIKLHYGGRFTGSANKQYVYGEVCFVDMLDIDDFKSDSESEDANDLVDEEHLVEEVEVNMNKFNFQLDGEDKTNFINPIQPHVNVTKDDLEVLDFDSLESDQEDVPENARSRGLTKLRKKHMSCGIRNNFYTGKEFTNRDLAKERIRAYAVEIRRNLDFKVNDKRRIKVICNGVVQTLNSKNEYVNKIQGPKHDIFEKGKGIMQDAKEDKLSCPWLLYLSKGDKSKWKQPKTQNTFVVQATETPPIKKVLTKDFTKTQSVSSGQTAHPQDTERNIQLPIKGSHYPPDEGTRRAKPFPEGKPTDAKDPEGNIQPASIGLPSTPLYEGTRKSQPFPEGKTTNPKDLEGDKHPVDNRLPATVPNECIGKTKPLPEGPRDDKDSKRMKPLADMESLTPSITVRLGTDAEYQVDQTQSTRFEVSVPDQYQGKTSSEVELDFKPLKLTTFADIQALLCAFDDDLKEDSDDDVFETGKEIDEYIDEPDTKEIKTYHSIEHATEHILTIFSHINIDMT